MIRSSFGALAVVACFVTGVDSQNPPPAGSLSDVSGVWVMEAEGHQFGLELEQEDESVQGVMLAMGRRILLVGTYVDRVLTLKGERPEDGHGSESAGPITATMRDDGTLLGELSTNHGRSKWTGSRLPVP